MIIWGGFIEGGRTDTGGVYDPVLDSWTSTSTVNAPEARARDNAVWTGDRMIIWSGDSNLYSGGAYDPDTDSWTAMSTVNAPFGAQYGKATWTGQEVVFWDNSDWGDSTDSGLYNPTSDSWRSFYRPNLGDGHFIAWTGDRLIVWSTSDLRGGLYNPLAGGVDFYLYHKQ
ncbi:MAG TPA: hypothetical protein DCQ11_02635 [Gammaproteobacteria bacterium]|nr:hypothetical protein [Gammaproteobacteria bacterium]